MKKLLLFLFLFVSFNLFSVDISNDYHYDISRGRVERFEKLWKFAEGTVTTTPTTVWMGSAVQPGLYVYPDQEYIMSFVSDNALDVTQTIIIQGLDRNWKKQEEFIEINGVVPVDTIYEYLRINRLSVLGGGSLHGSVSVTATGTTTPLYSYISDGGFDRNQTQQAFVSIAAGHSLLAESIDMTTYESKKTNIYLMVRDWGLAEELGLTDTPFRVQFNWNLFNSAYQPISRTPIEVTEKIDVELRGFTENSTDQATSILQGVLIQNKSVPIDVSNFVATPGDGQIVLTWDALTPAENSDQKYFEIEFGETGGRMFFLDAAVGDVSKTLAVLKNGVEYTITVRFVGYDGLKSTGVVDTATPTI